MVWIMKLKFTSSHDKILIVFWEKFTLMTYTSKIKLSAKFGWPNVCEKVAQTSNDA